MRKALVVCLGGVCQCLFMFPLLCHDNLNLGFGRNGSHSSFKVSILGGGDDNDTLSDEWDSHELFSLFIKEWALASWGVQMTPPLPPRICSQKSRQSILWGYFKAIWYNQRSLPEDHGVQGFPSPTPLSPWPWAGDWTFLRACCPPL